MSAARGLPARRPQRSTAGQLGKAAYGSDFGFGATNGFPGAGAWESTEDLVRMRGEGLGEGLGPRAGTMTTAPPPLRPWPGCAQPQPIPHLLHVLGRHSRAPARPAAAGTHPPPAQARCARPLPVSPVNPFDSPPLPLPPQPEQPATRVDLNKLKVGAAELLQGLVGRQAAALAQPPCGCGGRTAAPWRRRRTHVVPSCCFGAPFCLGGIYTVLLRLGCTAGPHMPCNAAAAPQQLPPADRLWFSYRAWLGLLLLRSSQAACPLTAPCAPPDSNKKIAATMATAAPCAPYLRLS